MKLYHIEVVISFSLWIKLTMNQLLLLFLCNFCSSFSYVESVLVTNLFSLLLICGYSANYNTQGAFVIIFLICNDVLNCLRSVGTIVITTQIGKSSLKIIFTKQFLTKASIFCCFDVFMYDYRRYSVFQVQAKISAIRLLFHYLSVSYDYGARNLDEYFRLL